MIFQGRSGPPSPWICACNKFHYLMGCFSFCFQIVTRNKKSHEYSYRQNKLTEQKLYVVINCVLNLIIPRNPLCPLLVQEWSHRQNHKVKSNCCDAFNQILKEEIHCVHCLFKNRATYKTKSQSRILVL